MEPLTIAGLTVLALIGLVIEYFTRLISRCLGVAWGLLKGAIPSPGAEEIGSDDFDRPDQPGVVGTVFRAIPKTIRRLRTIGDDAREGWPVNGELHAGPEAAGRPAIVDARPWLESSASDRCERIVPRRNGPQELVTDMAREDRSRLAYMRPGTPVADVLPASPQVHGQHCLEVVREQEPSSEKWVEPAQNTNPTRSVHDGVKTAEAEARVLAEVVTIVAHLVSVESNLARGGRLDGDGTGLLRLKNLAVNYDLDDLMSISDNELNHDAIMYYRDVSRTVLELEEFFLNASSTQPFEDGAHLVEQERVTLQASVADEIARGTRMAQCLRRGAEDAASGSPAGPRLTSS